MRHSLLLVAAAALVSTATHAAGPIAPAAGLAGSDAISKDSVAITNWASAYLDYLPGSGVDAQWQTPAKALGPAVGDSFDIVSLGNAGRITLSFSGSIVNGTGADFAVFEKAFNDNFLELAKLGRVEVSSDGSHFFRFPAYSLTPAAVGAFGSIDPTNIQGLAGKYRQGFSTPFDLADLSGTVGLDVNNVRYVRIVDVVGDGTEFDDYPAAFRGPHKIYDPYPTTGSAGFDLDAIGVMHFAAAVSPVPEPGQFALFGDGLTLLLHLARRHQRKFPALHPTSKQS